MKPSRKIGADPRLQQALEAQRRIAADPRLQRALEAQHKLLSDPRLLPLLEIQRKIAADPRLQQALEAQRKLLSDPHLQQVLKLLSDPHVQQALEAQRQQVRQAAEAGTFAHSFDTFEDPDFVQQLEAAADDGQESVADIAHAVPEWAAEVEEASPPVVDPWDDAGVRKWADALPDAVAIKLAIRTCDVLTGVLLLLAAVNPATAPLLLVAAADVLLRIARALHESIEERTRR